MGEYPYPFASALPPRLGECFLLGVGDPQRVCPAHIERRDRRRIVLGPVYSEEHISRLYPRNLRGTAFKNVQEEPVLRAGLRKAAERGINRMLGKKLSSLFVVESGMTAAEFGQKLPDPNFKSADFCCQ